MIRPFHKSLSNNREDHLTVKHFSVGGQLEFKVLLFIPKHAPFELFEVKKKQDDIKLYIHRVFIVDDCEDLILEDLNYVKGIVDSKDLPFNISCETLQQNRILKVIRKNIVEERMELLTELFEDKDNFKEFYEAFSKNINKLGVHRDSRNRGKLAEFLRFYFTKALDKQVVFKDCVTQMPENQKSIYYLSGEALSSVCESSFLEQLLKKKGFVVLLFINSIDKYAVTQPYGVRRQEFDPRLKIRLGTRGHRRGETAREAGAKSFDDLCKAIEEALGDKVEKVGSMDNSDSPPTWSVSWRLKLFGIPQCRPAWRRKRLSNEPDHQGTPVQDG